MYKALLREQLFDKFEDNSTVAIFGACPAGERILEDIKKYKKNVEIACFIDNFVKGNFADLPIYTLKEFIDKNLKCDMVIMSTKVNVSNAMHILRIYDYNVLEQTIFLYKYYRFANETFEKALNIFERQEDKNLYKLLFDVRLGLKDKSLISEYYNATFPSSLNFSVISRQYLDKVNKNAVKTIFDIGFCNGLNAVAYNKFLPNLERIYAFEALYDECRVDLIEEFFEDLKKVEIINKAVGNKKGEIKFLYSLDGNMEAAFSKDISTKIRNIDGWNEMTVPMIDLDSFVEERKIKPDLIKMDIEGAEMSALKGAMKTIKKSKPQLAISIYHSNKDFVEIPVYLKENLENYSFKLEHYGTTICDTVLYAIPNELNY